MHNISSPLTKQHAITLFSQFTVKKVNTTLIGNNGPISSLDKWFPLQGERAQSLKVFNVPMLGFKNKIEMRKRRQNNNRPINLPQGNNILHILHVPKTLNQGHIQFSIIVVLPCIFPSYLHARMSIGGN